MLTAKEMKEDFVIFTDGACSGNPGPGGWATVIVFPAGKRIKELGGQGDLVTNNQMELMGVIKGLSFIKDEPGPVIVYTDSVYVIKGITQWIFGWLRRGWKTAEGEAVSNKDLWQTLKTLVDKRGPKTIEWRFSRGHIGTPGNERCDEIAVLMTKRKWADLYDGPLSGYGLAIYDLPEQEALPENKAKTEPKAPAFSYLSLVGGVVRRHKNWPSCERYTKGKSGAKFKKAMAAADESEILKTWGAAGSKIEDVD